MDKEKLLKLADAIEGADQSANSEFAFDMRCFYDFRHRTEHSCGTAACIQGWAQHIDPKHNAWVIGSCEIAGFSNWCGVSLYDANEICEPQVIGVNYDNIKPHHAVAMLRHFVDTGDVVWNVEGETQ